MAKKSIKRNYIYNLSYQVLLVLTPLITTPYLSRILGADGIGNVSYAESITSYFVLFATLGMTTYGRREISYVQDNKEERSRIFWETKILEIITTTIALSFFVLFAIFQDSRNLYFAFAMNVVAVAFDITWFFQGMEEFGKIVFRNFLIKVINIIFIFLFITQKDDYLIYAFSLAFFTLISNISLWIYLPRYLCKINIHHLKAVNKLPSILALFLPTIAINVYTLLDKTMIGIITKNVFENGYYEQATKIARVLLSVVTALGTVMIPRIGYHYGKKNFAAVNHLMYRGYRFVWLLGVPMCFGLIGTAKNFVPWFLGDGFDEVIPLLSILSFLILAIGINNVTGIQYLIPTKREKLFTLTVIIGAATNFTMNIVLIPALKSIGAAIASVTAETVIAVVQLIFVRKELSSRKVLYSSIHYLFAGIIMLFLLLVIGWNMSPSIIHTIILVAYGGTVYFAVLLLLRDDFLIENIKSIFIKFFRRA